MNAAAPFSAPRHAPAPEDVVMTLHHRLLEIWAEKALREIWDLPLLTRIHAFLRNLRHGRLSANIDMPYNIRISDTAIEMQLLARQLPAGRTSIVIPGLTVRDGQYRLAGTSMLLEVHMPTPTALNRLHAGHLRDFVADRTMTPRAVYLTSPTHIRTDPLPYALTI